MSRQLTKRTSIDVDRMCTAGAYRPVTTTPPVHSPQRRGPLGMARTASLYRSVTLFRAFLREQTDPDLFYGVLAADSARQVGEYVSLEGATVLDVGGGPGYFAEAFRGAGATYVGPAVAAGEMVARGKPEPGTVRGSGELEGLGKPHVRPVRGSGEALPVQTKAVDVCYSSNVQVALGSPQAVPA